MARLRSALELGPLVAMSEADRGLAAGAGETRTASAAGPEPERSRLTRVATHVNAKGAAFIVLFTCACELAVRGGLIPDYVPAPSRTLRALWSGLFVSGAISDEIPTTLAVFAVGLLLAAAIGIGLGIVRGLWGPADRALHLSVELLRPLPAVALIPLLILVLGIGAEMRVAVIVYAAVWPILFNTYYGVRGVDPIAFDTARNFGLSRRVVIWRVVLPSALPAIATGLRISATIALITTIVAELVASTSGLGYFIAASGAANLIPDVYAGIILAGLLGFLVNAVLVSFERRFLFWDTGTRQEALR